MPHPAPQLLAAASLLLVTCTHMNAAPEPAADRPPFRSFAVYALSRGKGVPKEAREALGKVRELVEADRKLGRRVRLLETRIGIEGETRLCAEYDLASDAERAYPKAEGIVKGVDLVNLKIESCPKEDEKEKKP